MSNAVILVLGMHRSGTSALTRVLNLLGISLGSELLRPQDDNSKGFWEHSRAVDIHEKLLRALGRNWHDVREMPVGWLEHPAAVLAVEEISALLNEELQVSGMWAVKDPRMCRLAPLWLRALQQQGRQARAVLVVRDPREVALSLHKRDGWTIGHSYLMWIQHFMEAFAATSDIPRAMVSYTQLLDDWRAVMQRVGEALAIDWPVTLDEAASEIDAFITPGDRHQRADRGERIPELDGAPLPPFLQMAYDQAQAVVKGRADWAVLEEEKRTYDAGLSIFSLPVRDIVEERNRIELVAIERMDNINGLLVAKENAEAREAELRQQVEKHAELADLLKHSAAEAAELVDKNLHLRAARDSFEASELALREHMETQRSLVEQLAREVNASGLRETQLRNDLDRLHALYDEEVSEVGRLQSRERALALACEQQRGCIEQLQLDQRELETIRESMKREREFIERAFGASEKIEADLRSQLLRYDSSQAVAVNQNELMGQAISIAERGRLEAEQKLVFVEGRCQQLEDDLHSVQKDLLVRDSQMVDLSNLKDELKSEQLRLEECLREFLQEKDKVASGGLRRSVAALFERKR